MVAFFTPPPFMSPTFNSEFIGLAPIRAASGAIVWPAGSSAGDLAVAFGVGSSAVSVPAWTLIAGDVVEQASSSSFAFKVLSSSDISAPPTITAPSFGACYLAVYRGGTTVSKRSTERATTATVSVLPFTKSPQSARILAFGCDRDPGTSPTPPSGFELRGTSTSQYHMLALYDLKSSEYTGLSSTVFNLVAPGSGYGGRGTLLEIT